MPRNARFDCAAKRRTYEEEEVNEERQPATSKTRTRPVPTGIK